MKLVEAIQLTSEHLNTLSQKKSELTKLLKDKQSENINDPNFDKVEISKQLSAVEKEYDQTKDIKDELSSLDNLIETAESTHQQNEQIEKSAQEFIKILKVYRRISKGDKVPFKDEKKLMDYSHELYASAKNMALLSKNAEGKKHKSLWKNEDENNNEKPVDPSELADNTEVLNPLSSVDSSVDEEIKTEE